MQSSLFCQPFLLFCLQKLHNSEILSTLQNKFPLIFWFVLLFLAHKRHKPWQNFRWFSRKFFFFFTKFVYYCPKLTGIHNFLRLSLENISEEIFLTNEKFAWKIFQLKSGMPFFFTLHEQNAVNSNFVKIFTHLKILCTYRLRIALMGLLSQSLLFIPFDFLTIFMTGKWLGRWVFIIY